MRISEIESSGVDRIFSTSAAEPLDYIIHYIAYKLFFRPIGLGAAICYQAISYIAGLIYIWAAWLIARHNKDNNSRRIFIIFYFLAWGGIQLFFGYAEEYGLAAAVLLLFIWQMIRFMNKKGNILFLGSLFLIGFFLHNLLLILLPSMIFMIVLEYKKNVSRAILVFISIIIPIMTWLIISYSKKESGAFLLPESGLEPGYLMWSWQHLLDIVNELFLVMPAFMIMLSLQRTDIFSKTSNDRLLLSVNMAGASAVFVLLLVDPQLGMARDWDLFALPLLMLHAALLLNFDWQKVGQPIIIVIIILMSFSTLSWIFVNANTHAAEKRYIDLLPLDYAKGGYGFDRLGFYYKSHHRLLEAEDAYNKAVSIRPHPRSYLNLAYVQADLGKRNEAITNLKKIMEIDPGQSIVLYEIGSNYFYCGDYQNALEYFLKYRETPEGKTNFEIETIIENLQILTKNNRPQKVSIDLLSPK